MLAGERWEGTQKLPDLSRPLSPFFQKNFTRAIARGYISGLPSGGSSVTFLLRFSNFYSHTHTRFKLQPSSCPGVFCVRVIRIWLAEWLLCFTHSHYSAFLTLLRRNFHNDQHHSSANRDRGVHAILRACSTTTRKPPTVIICSK